MGWKKYGKMSTFKKFCNTGKCFLWYLHDAFPYMVRDPPIIHPFSSHSCWLQWQKGNTFPQHLPSPPPRGPPRIYRLTFCHCGLTPYIQMFVFFLVLRCTPEICSHPAPGPHVLSQTTVVSPQVDPFFLLYFSLNSVTVCCCSAPNLPQGPFKVSIYMVYLNMLYNCWG